MRGFFSDLVGEEPNEDKKSGRFVRTKKKKPINEHIIFKAPALITKTTWDQIQAQTEANKVKGTHTTKETETLWLRDMLTCGECGGKLVPKYGAYRKDGTRPKYYCCHWRGASQKVLRSVGRLERCALPLIRANEIETRVWQALLDPIRLLMNPERVKPLIDKKDVTTKLAQYDDSIKSFQADLRGVKLGVKRIMAMLQKPDAPELAADLLLKQLNDLETKRVTIEARIDDVKQQKADLYDAVENNKAYQQFIQGHKKQLKSLIHEIIRLKPEHKKRLVEGSFNDKIKVVINQDYMRVADPKNPKSFAEYETVAEGKWLLEWPEASFSGHLNIAVLKRFLDEGVIGKPMKIKGGSAIKSDQNTTLLQVSHGHLLVQSLQTQRSAYHLVYFDVLPVGTRVERHLFHLLLERLFFRCGDLVHRSHSIHGKVLVLFLQPAVQLTVIYFFVASVVYWIRAGAQLG